MEFWRSGVGVLVLLVVLSWSGGALGVFSEPEETNQERLVVHVVPHTHDDVGWLKTVDQYYYGSNNSIYYGGVQYILDGVYNALLENPDRRFSYVEMAFFTRWWYEQTPEVQESMRQLVNEGRFEFINAGWAMNDEACTHYEDTVFQMTAGHQFILQEFGVTTNIGWQIDPFGHASAQAQLFALMGFDAVFFARLDYQDYGYRRSQQNLELLWRGSQSLGAQSDIFAHILFNTSYCYPSDFAWEYTWGGDPIMDDPRLFNYNLVSKAEEFIAEMRNLSAYYKTNQVLTLFGCDFRYQNALQNFVNIEKLMKYINSNSTYNVELRYSTPSKYLAAVNNISLERDIPFQLKTDDFFPYSSAEHDYWSGYYTSRPAFKGYVRTRSNIYQAVHKLYATAGFNDSLVLNNILAMVDPLGISQHHDSITGTEQQHVTDDYAKRLYMGTEANQQAFSEIFTAILFNFTHEEEEVLPRRAALGLSNGFSFCEYLNQSICPPLDYLGNLSSIGIPIAVYNPIAWDRVEYLRLPVPISNLQVTTGDGDPVLFWIIPCEDASIVGTPYTLVIQAKLPAMGFGTYHIQQTSTEKTPYPPTVLEQPETEVTIENEYLLLTFSPVDNNIQSVMDKSTNQTLKLQQLWFWYNASDGQYGQQSGAYTFRPNSSLPFSVGAAGEKPTLTIVASSDGLIVEARQTWSSWVNQTYRLYSGQPFIEVESTVGPIPFEDDLGKEVVTRYITNIPNNGTFYTDSQGLEMQKRIYNYRPTFNLTQYEPVAGNYYPVDTAVHIFDEFDPSGIEFSVIVDRSRGCSSLYEGELEVMVHRRLLVVQGGVAQPLNESTIVRSLQRLTVSTSASAFSPAYLERTQATLLNHPVIIGFGSPYSLSALNPKTHDESQPFQESMDAPYSFPLATFSPLAFALPPNIHFQTLEVNFVFAPRYNTLLRFHHLYGLNEDPAQSLPAQVDLNTLFTDLVPTDIMETTLTAVRPLSELNRLTWNSTVRDPPTPSAKANAKSKKGIDILDSSETEENAFVITLSPMEIRTFLVNFVPRG